MRGTRELARLFLAAVATASVLALTACGSVDSSATTRMSAPAPAATKVLAASPPMGWNSWNHFGCSVTAADVEAAADAIVRDGLRSLGYRYVNVDDCWQAPTRDARGRLRADPTRFPQGMKALGDYIHARGLSFGIYATPGRRTCAELYNDYPGTLGSLGHESLDARTFASWGADYLKYDWCSADRDGVSRRSGFSMMRQALDTTGRPIVFSIHDKPEAPVAVWRASVADLWRTTHDIHDTWASMIGIANTNAALAPSASLGHWNDPDMLEVGNGGMTTVEYRTQFSLWCEMAAPLLAGNDLGSAGADALAILGNARAIAIDQDVLGGQARILSDASGQLVLAKDLADGSVAITLTNETDHGTSLSAALSKTSLGALARYHVVDVWTGGVSDTVSPLVRQVDAHATVMLVVSPG
ncbi:glycoside hydrolase family 27 protein [Parafrigoribacterium soli]|uniref:glycoside hydrolase family 27 protein n=1 Tax=Parafrigoribacterium soli TaxID=3144663 RepID=UPI0032EF16CF